MLNVIYRFFADKAIKIENGRAEACKGKIAGWVLTDLASVFQKQGIEKGEIWISSGGRITFSKTVPSHIHQRLRNIVASR